jgi:hypothetical protein
MCLHLSRDRWYITMPAATVSCCRQRWMNYIACTHRFRLLNPHLELKPSRSIRTCGCVVLISFARDQLDAFCEYMDRVCSCPLSKDGMPMIYQSWYMTICSSARSLYTRILPWMRYMTMCCKLRMGICRHNLGSIDRTRPPDCRKFTTKSIQWRRPAGSACWRQLI